MLYLTDDGKYYAKFDVATDNIVKEKDCFFVFSTSNTTSGVTPGDTNVTINEVAKNNFLFSKATIVLLVVAIIIQRFQKFGTEMMICLDSKLLFQILILLMGK